jgi:gliding motility-associated-like protein
MKKSLLIIALLLTGFCNLFASHIPGGNITWTCDPTNPLCYNFIFTQVINCPSTNPTTMGNGFTITNSCGLANPVMPVLNQTGLSVDVAQTCATATSTCNGGTVPGAWLATYEGQVCFPANCDSWTIDYELCCRDANSNTAGGSGNSMHLQSVMNTLTAPCNNGPVVTAPQFIPYMCAGQNNTYCLTTADPDADSTYYQMTSPLAAGGVPIAYNLPYTINAPLNGFVLDPTTGCMSFNQTTTGNFVVAIMINSYDVFGNLISSVTQDYQIEVITCTNVPPNQPTGGGITNFNGTGGNGGAAQTGPGSLAMCYGDNVCFDITFADNDPANILTLTTDGLALMPGATFTTTGTNPIVGTFCWTAQPGWIGNVVTFSVQDDACPIVGTNSFAVNFDITTGVWTGPDDTICGAQTSQLISTGGSGLYTWTSIAGPPLIVGTNFSCNPCANPLASPTATTTYVVTSTLSAACQNTDTVTVYVVPDFTPTLTQSAASTCLFDPVQLNVNVNPAGPGFTYQWTPSTFLDFDNIANPLATITTPGTYTYYVDITNSGGCVKSDSVTLVITNNVAPTFTMTAADSMLFCGQCTQFTLIPDTLILAGAIDDFNGVLSPNWQTIQSGVQNIDCGSMTGNALHFNGITVREAITIPQNVTSCTTVDFCLFIGNAGSGGAPCENADANEDVELSYSITGAAGPWILIQLYDSDDWDAAGPYNNTWTCFSVPIPPGAQTASTLFKWDQPQFSACTGCDNWALDDVSITCPATANNNAYAWTPSASLNDDTLQNPIGCPQQTTTYVVTVTDPNGGCTTSDSVVVFVQCGTCYPVVPTVTNVTCKDGTDGGITVVPNFVFASEVQTLTWTDSISGAVLQVTPNLTAGMTDSLMNLSAGAYTISMQDSSGCISDTTIWITEPDSVLISSISPGSPICIGGATPINATAIGGNGAPYTFTWTDLSTGTVIPGNGPHNVSPILSPTCYSVFATDPLGCISSASQVCVSLHPSLIANTSNGTPLDTIKVCPASANGGPFGTNITMNTVGGSGTGYNYDWFDNGTLVGNGGTITVTPTTPTTYLGVATDDCTTPADSVWITINWFNVITPDFIKNKADSCYPITIEFSNTSSPVALIGNTQWAFSGGGSSNGDPVSNTFNTPSCQDVTMTVTTLDGCSFTNTKVGYICPYDYPVANFSMNPPITDLLNTQIQFTNLSDGGTPPLNSLWNFGSGLFPDTSVVTHPLFIYPDNVPGTYNVLLTVTDINGCQDTVMGTIVVNGIYLFYVPNSFTPDGDGTNDLFRPYGEGIDFSQYTMEIFDRWGEKLFSTSNAERGWDGTYKGKPVQNGTYVWKIIAKEDYGTIIHDNFGHVNLIK